MPDSRLAGPARRLLVVQSLVLLGNSLAGVFVTIFLWQTRALGAVGLFNFYLFAVIPVVFLAGGFLVKASRKAWGLTLGAFLYAAFYALLLVLGNGAGDHLALLGVVDGTAIGLTWVNMHTLSYDLVPTPQRDRYFGLSGLFNTLSMLLGPLVAGFIIFRLGGVLGYRVVFGAAVATFALETVLSLGLQTTGESRAFEWRQAFSLQVTPGWLQASLAHVVTGTREGLLTVVGSVLLYTVGSNALDFGRLNSAFALMTSLAYFLAGRLIKPGNRRAYFTVGAWGTLAAPLAVALLPGPAGILAFTLLNAVFPVFWSVPYYSQYFDLVQAAPGSAERRVEYIAAREIWLAVGRLASVGAFLAAGSSLTGAGMRLLLPLAVLPILLLPRLMAPRAALEASISAATNG